MFFSQAHNYWTVKRPLILNIKGMNKSLLHTVPHRFFPEWASKMEPDGSSAT